MAHAAARPGRRSRPRRGNLNPSLVPGLLLVLIGAAYLAHLKAPHEIWPWVAAAGGASLIALAAAISHREHDRRYRSLLDRVPVGLYRTSPAGRIIDANPALAHILGFETPADLFAAPAQSVYLDPADREQWTARVNEAQGPVAAELHMRRPDGRDIWARDLVIPVRDRRGRVRFYEGELEDITESRRHREEIEAALRSKIELIGTVSHELRTPLTSIVGYAHLLGEEGTDFTPEERAEMARVLEQQAEDAVEIVEDLLTAAQADAGTLRVVVGPMDLGEEARRGAESLAQRHTGSLDVDTAPVPALGDAMRVRQVIRNLVANAVVHGGDHIRVVTTTVGRQARALVIDDGPGLAPGDEGRVFEPFQRGARGGAHGSAGLGLTISRHLARLMGGDLTYRRLGGETVFSLILPGRAPANLEGDPRPWLRASVPVG